MTFIVLWCEPKQSFMCGYLNFSSSYFKYLVDFTGCYSQHDGPAVHRLFADSFLPSVLHCGPLVAKTHILCLNIRHPSLLKSTLKPYQLLDRKVCLISHSDCIFVYFIFIFFHVLLHIFWGYFMLGHLAFLHISSELAHLWII